MEQTRTMRTGFVVAMTGLVATVILAACSGGGGSGSNIFGGGNGSTGDSGDAFMAKVITVVATAPDNTDAELIDSIVATSPDTSEPVAVVF